MPRGDSGTPRREPGAGQSEQGALPRHTSQAKRAGTGGDERWERPQHGRTGGSTEAERACARQQPLEPRPEEPY
eukprot:4329477-Pyramimonas_sp.AAC.1